jgi:hypothetical protein
MAEITEVEDVVIDNEEVEVEIEDNEEVEDILIAEEITESVEEEEDTGPIRRKCKGFFAFYPTSDFTQSEDYCDTYLKSKGLFVGDIDEEETD